MITKLEASHYRCLREVRQQLQPYQILVGPNGSGTSAFLDVIAFLGDVVSRGLHDAVADRTENFYDLVWGRSGRSFHLALEATRPEKSGSLPGPAPGVIRYEIEVVIDANDSEILISREELAVFDEAGKRRPLITRDRGHATFSPEIPAAGYLGFGLDVDANYSSLGTVTPFNLHNKFPSLLWFKALLRDGVKTVALDNKLLRGSSPPGAGGREVYNGFNFARLVGQLRDSFPGTYESWLRHVQTAVPDIEGIRMIERPEDKHRYLMIRYSGGVEVPQWMVSDGTLRLLALTFLAYLPAHSGAYLVEEPEVGVHPTAIETVMQSLSSVYEGQVLVTSHSPVVLSLPRPDQLLCFQKTQDGTAIIPGDEHPLLKEWRSGVDLSDLFAAGVLS
jgi:predicted ATPase